MSTRLVESSDENPSKKKIDIDSKDASGDDSDAASLGNSAPMDDESLDSLEDDEANIDENSDLVTLEKGGIVKKILKRGEGKPPPSGAEVVCHYTGTLNADGTQFDSSRDRNEPFKFKIGKGSVIKGWDKGIATMKPGERAVLTCKPEFAYGKAGSPPKIPADATLDFDVELISWCKEEDITKDKDRGVLKNLLKEGSGWDTVGDKNFADATAIISGCVRGAAAPFWPKEKRELKVGEDISLPQGLEMALRSMKKGEYCTITVAPQYGYGAKGNTELGVPPNAMLEYEVELESFKKGQDRWSMTFEEKIELMNKLKGVGNSFFGQQQWKRASEKYKEASSVIEKYDEDKLKEEQKKEAHVVQAACHSNQAACHIKSEEYDKAIKAADEALKKDPNMVKAYFRRGQARFAQKQWQEALEDLQKLRELAPDDKSGDKMIASAKQQIAKETSKQRKLFSGMFDKVRFTTKADEQRAKKTTEPADDFSDDEVGDSGKDEGANDPDARKDDNNKEAGAKDTDVTMTAAGDKAQEEALTVAGDTH